MKCWTLAFSRMVWLASLMVTCGSTFALTPWEDPTVREVGHVPMVDAATERALQQLRLVVPDPGQAAPTTRMVERQHVTWGELFEKGRVHALVELQGDDEESTLGTVVLATWQAFQWKVDQVFEMSLYREPVDTFSGGSGGGSEKAPRFGKEDEQLFSTMQFSPSMAPALVVKVTLGEFRGQDYAVLHYDPAIHRLTTPGLFSSKMPHQKEGYWVFPRSFRSKYTRTSYAFYDVHESRLRFRGSLFSSSGGGSILTIKVGFPVEKDGKASPALWVFRTSEDDPSIYRIHLPDDKPTDLKAQLGQVKFLKPQSGSHVCAGYFLKKLAGLPHTLTTRTYHMGNRVEVKVPEDVPDADVIVSGSAEVRRAFLDEQVP